MAGIANPRQHQVDEVKVFETFGGDLPVIHQSRKPKTENEWATVHTTLPVGERKSYFHGCAGIYSSQCGQKPELYIRETHLVNFIQCLFSRTFWHMPHGLFPYAH
ncbi:hypothetical protein [Paenibacillus sp.]|uniref:hypothetical protein n=1 Tax=Paenibacillus sp. TaxID=58172 RepID=UPI00282E40D6|nr:hypothetical protein [Paenibacillus sp.]MDR0270991.1 hypothetical protein [Paenibacillus sp.]